MAAITENNNIKFNYEDSQRIFKLYTKMKIEDLDNEDRAILYKIVRFINEGQKEVKKAN